MVLWLNYSIIWWIALCSHNNVESDNFPLFCNQTSCVNCCVDGQYWLIFNTLLQFCYLLIFNLFINFLQIVNNPCSEILTAHFRLEGKSSHVNLLKKVIQTTKQSYLFYEPSKVKITWHNKSICNLFQLFVRVIFITMFVCDDIYVIMKQKVFSVKCVRLLRVATKKESCCVISSLENLFLMMLDGEFVEINIIRFIHLMSEP